MWWCLILHLHLELKSNLNTSFCLLRFVGLMWFRKKDLKSFCSFLEYPRWIPVYKVFNSTFCLRNIPEANSSRYHDIWRSIIGFLQHLGVALIFIAFGWWLIPINNNVASNPTRFPLGCSSIPELRCCRITLGPCRQSNNPVKKPSRSAGRKSSRTRLLA